MSLNAQLVHTTATAAARPLSHRFSLMAIVGACIAVDIVAIRYVAQNWDAVSPYVPYAVFVFALGILALRARAVLLSKE